MLGWAALGVALFLALLGVLHSPGFLRRPLPATRESGNRKTNVLLLVAHPDDECMFFAPTLLSLAQLGTYSIRVLCLSTGNADGLGAQRKLEMVAACSVLKVPAENVDVLDHPALQDGFASHWDQSLILKLVREAVTAHNVHIILTFDNHGISGHPNHCSVSGGVRAYLLDEARTSINKGGSAEEVVQCWELVSTNILRKFCGPLEMYASLLEWACGNQEEMHCFVNPSPKTSIWAMSRHQSQWVWYRRLFVLFARYTYINTLKKMTH